MLARFYLALWVKVPQAEFKSQVNLCRWRVHGLDVQTEDTVSRAPGSWGMTCGGRPGCQEKLAMPHPSAG